MTRQAEPNALRELVFVDAALRPSIELVPLDSVDAGLARSAHAAWSGLASLHPTAAEWRAQVDRRSGLVEIAEGAGIPWIPGHGNRLTGEDVAGFTAGSPEVDLDALERIARDFAAAAGPLLGASAYELRLNRRASGRVTDHVWFVEFDVYAEGLRIEGARVFFRVNSGNLIQFGAERVPAPGTAVPRGLLGRAEAHAALDGYVGLVKGVDRFVGKTTLKLLPVAASGAAAGPRPGTRCPRGGCGDGDAGYALGRGYELLPVWEMTFRRGEEHPTWRARVDAVTGRVVEFLDTNRYPQVSGGYWPVSWRVGGTEQAQVVTGWPFVTINPLATTSNTSGIYSWDGNPQTARHVGPFVNINDMCAGAPGTAGTDGAGDIAFGEILVPNAPGDCQDQNGINDNSPAARQQFWHLNKIMEKGRAYLPANAWLQAQLTANVNIASNCNAFWNGSTVNFYTSGGGCGNTGEDAGIALHEWGHGLDSNDGNGSSIENGTGETYGDFTAALQTLDSCTGWGFLGGNCGGYGNACLNCDGVRDIDWGKHANNAPMTVASFTQPLCPSDLGGGYNGPCGNGAPQPDDKEGHCESYVSSGALWDLAAADLQAGCTPRNPGFPDYNCPGAGGPYNQAGAWGVVDRLWYQSRPTANQAFTCFRTSPTWTSDGCNAGSNWKTFRAIDDDDGNLANGTPHACQIAAAFNRHGIGNTPGSSCAADVTTCFRGCPQPAAPTLNAPTAGNNQLTLDWSPNPAPDVIDVFRNEIGCGSGFAKIAEDVSGTLYVDSEVANGTTYYYQIVRHPVGNESCASPPSGCVSGTPVAGPSAKYVDGSATLVSVPVDNDGDGFVDNCETGRLQVGIVNDGLGALTNVRFTVTSPDAEVTIATAMPVGVGNLPVSTQTTGTFDFSLDGASCGQAVDFDIAVTADEMTGSNLDVFDHGPVEQDLVLTASRTDDFETGNDGWTFPQGYARENVTAASGVWSVHSSSGLDDQNDVALSPIFRKGAGATQVVIAERHDIEAPFWDRANVHAIRLSDGSHTLLTPTGRTYTAGGPWNPVGHVGTQPGWAGTNLAWGDATFDLSGLVVGESYRLEVNYNTDAAVVGTGHWFDNVRWTNVSFQVCDAQSDLCTPCTPPGAPTGLTATADLPNQIRLDWNAVAPAPASYRVYRATASGGPYALAGTVGGGTLSFTDTGLAPGVTYYYVVRAFDVCESADSNEDSETAFGDCTTPPSFGGLASVAPISAGGSCGLRLDWAPGVDNCGGEPLVYNVYRSTSSGFTPGPGNLLQSCVTDTFWDDTTTASGTTYYYVVQAEDATVGNGGACRDGNQEGNTTELSGVVGGAGAVTLYSNDFEAGVGLDDWTTGFFGGSAGQDWRGIQTCTANSGTDIFRFGGTTCTGNYASNKFQYAQPAGATGIAVPAAGTNVTLSFFHRRQFETNFDGGVLALSLDGANYTVVPASAITGTSYNGTLLDSGGGGCSPFPGVAAFTGTQASFSNTQVDLDAVCDVITAGSGGCAGQSLYIGFTGITDCSITQDGWFLDDVVVTADTPGSCNLAPNAVSFLTATARDTENVLEWLNPAAGGYGSTMVRWSTGGYPTDPADGTLLVDQNDGLGSKGTTTHAGLTNGATYYYSAFVDNGVGEYSARKTVSARPFDTSGNVAWAYSTGASALAPPGIGSVYGVANDRVLHSIDTAGTGVWPPGWQPMAMNGPAQARPPIVPVTLGAATKVAFLGSQDGHAYAVDADTGQQLWASPALAPAGSLVQAAPAGSFAAFGGDDLLMVGTRHSGADNQVHGLDFSTGAVVWSFTNSVGQGGDGSGIGIISGAAALDLAGQRLYFASRARPGGSQDTVWCLSYSGAAASLVWSRALGDVDGSPTLFGGRVYVGTNSGEVHALDATTGADAWSSPFDAGDGPIKSFVFPRFGTSDLFFSTTGTVWSISDDGAGASLNWSEATIPSPSSPLVSFANPLAWVGGGDGRLYQLDFSGGSPLLSSVVLGDGSAAVGSPALDVSNDTAYVGTDAGRIYPVALPLP